MQLTKGSVSVNNTGVDAYGTALKNIISAMVQVIPGLSIKEVTTDTGSVYNVTLSYRSLELKIWNKTSSLSEAFGNSSSSASEGAVRLTLANIYYLYNVSSGVFSVKCVYPQDDANDAWGFSVIPITVTLAGGGTKELLFGVFDTSSIGASTFTRLHISNYIQYSQCFDPSTGNAYNYTMNTPSYQYPGKTGNTVVIPRIFSCDYGEVTSYEVNGGQFYVIYPGCEYPLADNYYGILPVFVGSVRYVCVGDTWMLA